MAVASLTVLSAYALVALVLRAVVQRRRTGDHGLRVSLGRPGSVGWWAEVLLAAGAVAAVATPVVALAVVVEPLGALDARPLRIAGIVVAAAGVAATYLVQLAMGASWRVGVDTDEHTDLVVDGPFAVVRNPIFTAMVVVLAGLWLAVPNPVGAASVVLVLVALHLQVRAVEEPHLGRLHGDAYRRYAARVGRFVPGLGRLRTG